MAKASQWRMDVMSVPDRCARRGETVTWVRGGFLSFLGGGSYRIRILMYFDVSCMYPACILKDTCIPYLS